jgi:hypothetical protein
VSGHEQVPQRAEQEKELPSTSNGNTNQQRRRVISQYTRNQNTYPTTYAYNGQDRWTGPQISGAAFPVIHATETIMALESGLAIDPVEYDLLHNVPIFHGQEPLDAPVNPSPYHIVEHNNTLNLTYYGPLNGPHSVSTPSIRPQQQQLPYPPNPANAPPSHQTTYAYDPEQPNNVYGNSDSQIQNPHNAASISTTPRSPGPKVGQPIPADLTPVITALRALPHVSGTEKHPVRTTLKFPFKEDALTAPQQQQIRQNFYSGSGYLRSNADLMGWFGDETVFSRVFWDYLVKGEPRAKRVKRDKGGGGKRQKRELG